MQQLLHLIEFLSEAFRCYVHHYQCLTVPVELAAMKFVFRFMVVGMFVCVKECMSFVMYLIIQYVGWGLFIMCISHIVRWCLVWGLLVVYVKFLGLFGCRCMYDEYCSLFCLKFLLKSSFPWLKFCYVPVSCQYSSNLKTNFKNIKFTFLLDITVS